MSTIGSCCRCREGQPADILCTGYSDLISEEKAGAIGIKGFALKPLTDRGRDSDQKGGGRAIRAFHSLIDPACPATIPITPEPT